MKVKDILLTSTFKQSSITFLGTLINGVLGAVFFIVLARWLGPASFGVFGLGVAMLTLIADVSDAGVSTGIVRFVGKYAITDSSLALKYLRASFKIRAWIAVAVGLVGLTTTRFVAAHIFAKPELETVLYLSFVGAICFLFYTLITYSFQAYQRFLHWSLFQITFNSLRLIFIAVLFYFRFLNLITGFAAYISVLLIGFLIGTFFLPKKLWTTKIDKNINSQLLGFNKWVGLFVIVSALSSRLDTFLSARLLTATDLGIYAAASQLTQIIPQIISSIGTVIAPKMAGMGNIGELKKYLIKSQLMVLGIAGLGMLTIPVSFFAIPLIYGKEYVAAVPVFIILLIAMLIFLISVPVHVAIIHYFAKPKLFWWLSLGHLFIISIFGYVLISYFGIIGAAGAVLVGNVFNFVIPLIWLLRRLKK